MVFELRREACRDNGPSDKLNICCFGNGTLSLPAEMDVVRTPLADAAQGHALQPLIALVNNTDPFITICKKNNNTGDMCILYVYVRKYNIRLCE